MTILKINHFLQEQKRYWSTEACSVGPVGEASVQATEQLRYWSTEEYSVGPVGEANVHATELSEGARIKGA